MNVPDKAMKKRKADEGDDGSDGEKIDEASPKA